MKKEEKKFIETREWKKSEPFSETIKKNLPKELIPTEKTNYALVGIFTLVVLVALVNFPLSELMQANADVSIKVGYPMTFLDFDLMDAAKMPVKIIGLIVDLVIYILVAYAIDVTINLFKSSFFKKKSEVVKKPKIYELKKK